MSKNTISRKFGWVRDRKDERDLKFVPRLTKGEIKPYVDLRNICPIVVDQGSASSCVGNAVAAILHIEQLQQGKVYYTPPRNKPYHDYTFAPSRLFIYYGARVLEGNQQQDDGCEIRDAIKWVAQNGVCTSSTWPYHIYSVNAEPPDKAYSEARVRGAVISYHRINNYCLNDMLICLSQDEPFVIGITVYDSFQSNKVAVTGKVPMPKKNKEGVIGGHAIAVVGYDLKRSFFLCRNSWGPDWGEGGYFWLPFAYLTHPDLAADAWVVTEVE